jgi:hypothetical protein
MFISFLHILYLKPSANLIFVADKALPLKCGRVLGGWSWCVMSHYTVSLKYGILPFIRISETIARGDGRRRKCRIVAMDQGHKSMHRLRVNLAIQQLVRGAPGMR